jgi:zinc protease
VFAGSRRQRDRPGSGQSVIFGAQLAPAQNDPDAIALQLVNGIFGGKFSSRINMNLREDKHWSYGVRAVLPAARSQRPYISISAVQTDKTKESMIELVKEYKNVVGGKPITEEELKDEQTNSTLALPGTFETVQQLSGAYGNILEYGLPEDLWFAKTLRALIQRLLSTWRNVFGLDSRLIGGGRRILPENVDGQRLRLGSHKTERA